MIMTLLEVQAEFAKRDYGVAESLSDMLAVTAERLPNKGLKWPDGHLRSAGEPVEELRYRFVTLTFVIVLERLNN